MKNHPSVKDPIQFSHRIANALQRNEPIRHIPGGTNLYAYRCAYRYKSALRKKKKSCLTKGICCKTHKLKCSFVLRSESVGWLCVILCVFHCIKIKFTPLRAEEMLFLGQPHILALVSITQAGWVFSHPGIRGFFDQHLIHLNCNADCRGWSLKNTPGISLVSQDSVCVCALPSVFSPLSTL